MLSSPYLWVLSDICNNTRHPVWRLGLVELHDSASAAWISLDAGDILCRIFCLNRPILRSRGFTPQYGRKKHVKAVEYLSNHASPYHNELRVSALRPVDITLVSSEHRAILSLLCRQIIGHCYLLSQNRSSAKKVLGWAGWAGLGCHRTRITWLSKAR